MNFGRSIFVVTAALATVTMTAGAARAVELIHGSWPPSVEYLNRITLPKAFKEIEAETKGGVKWKLVPGGQLANPKESFQATSDGVIHGALGISTYVPNLVPSLNTIYSTIVFEQDVVAATGAAVETLTLQCPSCISEFKKINIVPLAGWTSSPYYLTCREPMAKLEDLKGKRIRGTGGNAILWDTAGAVPVAATLPEATSLLQRGGLDCVHGVFGWNRAFGYADFAKNITDYPLGLTGPAIGLMLNRTAWNKMSKDQKMVHVKQAAYISAEQAIGQFVVENAAILKDLTGNKGVKMIKAEQKGFADLIAKFEKLQRNNNIGDAKKFGVADPGAIIDTYQKNLKKWAGLTKNVGNDAKKLQDLIWSEIYSKVDLDKL